MAPIPITSQTPQHVREQNLLDVVHAFESAGVDHVVVRTAPGTRTAVAVRSAHATAALAALASLDARAAVNRPGLDKPDTIDCRDLATVSDVDTISFVRVFRNHAHIGGSLKYGREYACDVEIWRPVGDGSWRAPRTNAVSSVIDETELAPAQVEIAGRACTTAVAFARRTVDDVDFPIDAVYLWVDGADPTWAASLAAHRGGAARADAAGAHRFRSFDELRWSLRSLDMYAPWIRRVHIVTDGQTPPFVDFSRDDIVLVDHRDIAPPDRLPMFNSDAISSYLHRVPGVAEHFLYMNDDVFFGRDVYPTTFFHPSGLVKVSPSNNQRPLGPPRDTDLLAVAKAKRVRALIEERYGRTIAQTVRHTPHAMTRSLMERMEADFGDAIDATRTHRFREPTDVPIEQLVHYVSQIIGLGTRGSASYGYVEILAPGAMEALADLLARRDRDVFCVNDGPEGVDAEPDDAGVRRFLDEYFPVPSRWER